MVILPYMGVVVILVIYHGSFTSTPRLWLQLTKWTFEEMFGTMRVVGQRSHYDLDLLFS